MRVDTSAEARSRRFADEARLNTTAIASVGLSDAEAELRRARGEGNEVTLKAGRSYLAIVRANLFTFFNSILFAIGIALIALGRVNDAITSVGLGFLIALIGTVQEFRSRRQLERIAVLSTPAVRLVRSGVERSALPSDIVRGDLVRLLPGDQIVADGTLDAGSDVDLDEALLTGEATPVHRRAGEGVRGGTICLSGAGAYVAEVVGRDSYVNKLTARVKQVSLARTSLQKEIDTVVRLVMLIVALLSVVLLAAAFLDGSTTVRFVQLAAVLSGQIPYGLFFVVVLAYAMSAAALARKGALVQQIDAVESLSDANVICLDKTGTLTSGRLRLSEIVPLGGPGEEDVRSALGSFVASVAAPNPTSSAIAAALNGQRRVATAEVSFSPARKWSAVAFGDAELTGVFALGAFDMMKDRLVDAAGIAEKIREIASGGKRVLLFAAAPDGTLDVAGAGLPPLDAMALVVLDDEIRPDVEATLRRFAELGVRVKVISGDDPATVAAIARRAGLEGELRTISGLALADMAEPEFAAAVQDATVFGRITPEQKERIVEVLMASGAHVAMIGDGVNDVLALKRAQLGIAMKSGSAAARNTADMVLLNDDFAPLVAALREGQRVKAGMANAMLLFIARVASSILAIMAIVMLGLPFPIEPSQVGLTLLTVGIPTSLLVVWAEPEPGRGTLARRLVRFTAPVAILTMLFGALLYAGVYYWAEDASGTEWFDAIFGPALERLTGSSAALPATAAQALAQSMLSTFLTVTAFLLILFIEPPARLFTGYAEHVSRDWRPTVLAVGLSVAFIGILSVPALAAYFGLVPASVELYALMALVVPVWAILLRSAWRQRWLARFLRAG